MRNRVASTFIVAVAFGAGPGVAGATTWCVKDPSCPAGGNSTQTTIGGAAGAAADGDTILIGPGTFIESVNGGGKNVNYLGAGPTTTVIQAPTSGTTTLATGGGLVANLGLELGGGAGGTALFTSGDATNVAITAPPGTTGGLGVALHGGSINDSVVTLPNGTGVTTTGIANGPGPSGAVQDSTITASTGLQGIVNVARDRIFATTGINLGNGTPGGGVDATFVINDTLVDTASAGPEGAISFSGGSAVSGNGVSDEVVVRHSTLVGDGAAGSTGIAATATANQGFIGVGVTLSSTIIRGYATALSTAATGANGHGAAASAFDDYSDFNPALESTTNAGSPTGTGAINDGTHNLNVDPGFVTTTAADPHAFQLLATSPLIDAGAPALAGGESPLDLNGQPRFVADHGNPVTISDIGAFEYQPHPPAVTASGPTAAVAAGKPVTFTANGTDPDPGDQVSLSWTFDDGATGSGSSAAHTFATAGTHSATVTATDLDGLSATATVHVTVVVPGRISRFSVKHRTVSYADSEPGVTKLTVQRASKHGHFTTVGSFAHTDAAGANRFALPSRIHGRKLGAGHYRLEAVPTNVAGHGPAAFATFRVA